MGFRTQGSTVTAVSIVNTTCERCALKAFETLPLILTPHPSPLTPRPSPLTAGGDLSGTEESCGGSSLPEMQTLRHRAVAYNRSPGTAHRGPHKHPMPVSVSVGMQHACVQVFIVSVCARVHSMCSCMCVCMRVSRVYSSCFGFRGLDFGFRVPVSTYHDPSETVMVESKSLRSSKSANTPPSAASSQVPSALLLSIEPEALHPSKHHPRHLLLLP